MKGFKAFKTLKLPALCARCKDEASHIQLWFDFDVIDKGGDGFGEDVMKELFDDAPEETFVLPGLMLIALCQKCDDDLQAMLLTVN